MASLNTFGAILSYAIGLETQLHDYYSELGDSERAKASDKRRKKLERVRRENVLEITLEPIEGLDEANYVLNFDDNSEVGQNAVETTSVQFYSDVAPKINVRQAQRALERCGKEHQALVTN
jgi:rubrerythrin